MTNRLESVLSWGGLLVLVLLLAIAVARILQSRGAAVSSLDEFGDATPASSSQRGGLQRILPDFATLLAQVVAPRRAAHPEWERLDGAYGVPGKEIARFSWQGSLYALNGESRMDALSAIEDWLRDHPGEDPLVIQHSKSKAGRLTVRPEVGWTQGKDIRIESV